jgi:hypothetical protein
MRAGHATGIPPVFGMMHCAILAAVTHFTDTKETYPCWA